MPVSSQLSLPEYLTLRYCILFGNYFGGPAACLVYGNKRWEEFLFTNSGQDITFLWIREKKEWHYSAHKRRATHPHHGLLKTHLGSCWVKTTPCSRRKVWGQSAASSRGMNPVRLFTFTPVNQVMFVKHFKLESTPINIWYYHVITLPHLN